MCRRKMYAISIGSRDGSDRKKKKERKKE